MLLGHVETHSPEIGSPQVLTGQAELGRVTGKTGLIGSGVVVRRTSCCALTIHTVIVSHVGGSRTG